MHVPVQAGTVLAYNSSDALRQHYNERLAATTGRWVDAEEIGDVAIFLCSALREAAVNGMAIPVDNGLHLIGC